MNIHSFDKKLHKGRLFGTLRRAVAGALTAVMLLPMVPTFGVGSQIKLQPIQDENYRPDIEIQSNFVRDDFGFLTGYMELGLRVKTGEEPFRYLAVSLEYDTELYTPVDWSATADEIKIQNMPTDTPKLPYYYYSEELPAQKEEHINFVRAYTGIPDDPADDKEIDPTHKATLTPEVKSGRHALFSFWASATDRLTDDENDSVDGVVFKEMTTIAVIRFKVNEDEMENFTIKKNSDGTGYDIFYKEEKVTNVVELQTEMNKPVANKWGKSVEFADDADIYVTEPDTELALEYRAGSVRLDADGKEDKVNGTLYERRYYYLPGYNASQNVKVNLVREGHTYANVDKPNYLNLLDPAVKVPSNVGDTDRFSYLTNLIVDKTGSADPKDDHYYVTFPVVSERSFMAGEDILDKLTTIVYVDWDNTLLGTQIVPQNTDVRGLVSDYVAENFIYHDADDTTYGDNDLNNPLALVTAANPNDLTPALDAVKSLERLYNYRGKYPAGGPEADGTVDNTTVDTDPASANTPEGSKYPLTNKLDYVFFKRPMGHDAATKPDPTTYPGGSTDPQYLADKATWENTWVQPFSYDSASNAYTIEYDVERPFAYGWAKCTQANFEDVWTTMGTIGELNSYTVDGNGVATVVYDGDYGFEFADLKTGFKTGEKTVFLKAVYEPGKDLLDGGFLYRMISKPYYNKLNTNNAEKGGAYSATMTYERASTEMPNDTGVISVRGVQRMREPYVRQDTTPDLLWEENSDLNISHNLPNATDKESYTDRNKTTFTKVEINNGEEITVTLTLSGRQNKVNYYLNDSYGSNFVAGDPRTANDGTRDQGTGEATLDNYNYFVDGQSDETDVWYDAPYKDKEGSRGFVLMGTLNQVMEKATQCNNGEITRDVFSGYVNEETLVDINLRFANGDAPDFFTLDDMLDKILAAAAAAVGNAAYWNTERDCAQLTYHQLQGFVIDGSLNHGEGPISGLTWCHLHKECADSVSDKPTTWPKLLEVARRTDPSPIGDLTMSEAEGTFHLRASGAGAAFASVPDFQSAVVAAVTALDAAAGNTTTAWTWDQVQKQILTDLDPTFTGTDYWWYDGATGVSLNSWSDLLSAAKDAYTPAKVPSDDPEDSTTWSTREDKLNQVESAFDANAAVAANATDPAWVRATENLCITVGTNEGQKFASFADFKTALTGALSAAKDAGVTAPTWYQVQYHVLHKDDTGYAFPATPTQAQQDEFDTYWWHNGNQKVTDLVTMLAAAQKAVGGDTTSWDSFTFADFCQFDTSGPTPVPINPELHFRKGFNGTTDVYTAGDFAAFKTAVLAFVQDPNVTIATDATNTESSWNQLQYWLIHPGCDFFLPATGVSLQKEKAYYWWRNGADGEAYTLSTGSTDANVKTLMEAAYRYTVNGNPKALDNLDAAAAADFRLIPSYAGTEADWDALTKYTATDIGNLKTALDNLMKESAVTSANYQNVVWRQIQHYILTNTYLETTDTNLPGDGVTDGYWWRDGNTNPASGDVNTPVDDLADAIDSYIRGELGAGATADNALKAYVDTLFGADKLAIYGNTAALPKPPGDLTTANKNNLKTKLVNLAKNLKGKQGVTGVDGGVKAGDLVDWYVLQYYMLNTVTATVPATGAMKTPAAAKAWCDSKGITAPSWVPAPSALFALRPMMMAPAAPVVETTLSADGLTETTKTTTQTWNETTGNLDTTIVTRVVTRVLNGETTTVITTTTTVTTIIDEETGEPVTTSDTKTTVTEELVAPETPLIPLPDDPYTIDPDTDVIEAAKPTEPPAESTVTPEETPKPDTGDKTESTGDADETTGETTPTPAPSDPVEADVPSDPETDPPRNNTGDDPGGPTTDPPETTEPSADPPDPGGGGAETLALARARLRLKPLSLISLRRTKAPPPLISVFTPNSSAGRALL